MAFDIHDSHIMSYHIIPSYPHTLALTLTLPCPFYLCISLCLSLALSLPCYDVSESESGRAGIMWVFGVSGVCGVGRKTPCKRQSLQPLRLEHPIRVHPERPCPRVSNQCHRCDFLLHKRQPVRLCYRFRKFYAVAERQPFQ